MNNLVKFDKLIFNIGTVKDDEILTLDAKCLEGIEHLDYVYYNNCSCVMPQITDEGIRITFNAEHSVGVLPEGITKSISRHVTAKLDPNVPQFLRDEKSGRRIPNPQLRTIQFQVVGNAISRNTELEQD